MPEETRWYWCLVHQRPEREGEQDRAEDVLGPYPSEDAARHWKDTVDERNEAWDAEDERWEGDDRS